MQPTELQVQRCLQALRQPVDDSTPRPRGSDGASLPEGLLHVLAAGPVLRSERLAEVRRRMAAGDQVTADELADRLVGRLVCDRIR